MSAHSRAISHRTQHSDGSVRSVALPFSATPMSNFDVHGGLAALRSQIFASDTDTRGPYLAATDSNGRPQGSNAPQLPRIQTNVGPSFHGGFSPSSSSRPNGSHSDAHLSSSNPRESAESSAGSHSGYSGPSTALTTPSASLDTGSGRNWATGSQQRVSAASSSRGSNSAFAYSDQLSSPGMAMTASFNDGEDVSFSSAGDSHGSFHGGSHNDEHGGGGGSGSGEGKDKSKKVNPLQDLIETETAYVAELSKVIKKVAGAWSRHNLPPAELDTMFRNIESIYRINRAFLKSLKEIGPNPSSPRALGDLLMRWIDDLEQPYVRFCENYFTDFDTWPGVQTNVRLKELLKEISAPTSPDGVPTISSDKKRQPGEQWTLDSLFALPQTRLKYYKKLYSRLLKSTHAGRSDHRLLVGANEKLDELLDKARNRISVGVLDDSPNGLRERNTDSGSSQDRGGPEPPKESRASPLPLDRSATESDRLAALNIRSPPLKTTESALREPATPGGDLPLSPIEPGRSVIPPPLIPPSASPQPLSPLGGPWNSNSPVATEALPPADELEKTLDMSKVLDLFTMQPKKCQLRINPPTLPFRRGLRKNADVVIDFVPLSTGTECVWRRGHIYLLTDLFLICDRMTPSERAQRNLGPDGMWLLFPPLAGKHLKVTEAGGPGNALNITILKKETIRVHVQSRQDRDQWIAAFDECNKFATNMGQKLKSGETPSSGAISSPSIAVTPSTSDPSTIRGGMGAGPPLPHSGEQSLGPSPHTSMASSTLDRAGSFNSVASFPRTAPNTITPDEAGRAISPDPRLQAPIGGLNGSPRAGSPNPRGISPSAEAGPTSMNFGPGGPRPGFPRPPPPGVSSPQNGPTMFGGGPPSGGMGRPPMMNGPPRPGMGPRPPPPSGPHQMANGRPPFRPPGPPGGPPRPQLQQQQSSSGGPGGPPPMRPRPPFGPNGMGGGRPFSPSSQEMRDNMRRPSAPNLRERAQGGGSGNITPPVRTRSASSLGSQGAPKLPSEMLKDGSLQRGGEYSPPSSPKQMPNGPSRSTVAAQMRCRLYLKQSHAQWKSLGNARLKLYHIMPANHKQLVVENDKKMLVSTIILTDAVERVGKVGVAVEVSDNGIHTGIIYMLQMRSEESAQGLFGELIDGGSRTVAIT